MTLILKAFVILGFYTACAITTLAADKIYCGCSSLFESGAPSLTNFIGKTNSSFKVINTEALGDNNTHLVYVAQGNNKMWNFYDDARYVIIPPKQPPWDLYPLSEHVAAGKKIHEHFVKNGVVLVLWMRYYNGKQFNTDAEIKAQHDRYEAVKNACDTMSINGKRHEIILLPVIDLAEEGKKKYGIDGWLVDAKHMTGTGTYAVAALMFAYLSGKNPQDYAVKTDETGKWCNAKAWELYNKLYTPSSLVQIGSKVSIDDFKAIIATVEQMNSSAQLVTNLGNSKNTTGKAYDLTGRRLHLIPSSTQVPAKLIKVE